MVVITIIGILIALLLPAVQAAREAARQVQCKNNLKQLALGCLDHEQHIGYFPTGGWGFLWVGDPDRGVNQNQPGGWIYNILPFIEQQAIHDLGVGDTNQANRQAAAAVMVGTPLAVFSCPTRRKSIAYPNSLSWQMYNYGHFLAPPSGRSDYAACMGDTSEPCGTGPDSLQQGDSSTYDWTYGGWCLPQLFTGISYRRSKVPVSWIRDGLSNTYLAGEKWCNPDWYETGVDPADDQNAYLGFDGDVERLGNTSYPPLQDQEGLVGTTWSSCFGSAHSNGFHMAFCDGSVQMMNYSLDPVIHGYLANRDDGHAVDGKKF